MKDKHCFSMCIRAPEGWRQSTEVTRAFVLFEKNLETGVWAADGVPTGKMNEETQETVPCKTLGPAVESTLLLKGLHKGQAVPKP